MAKKALLVGINYPGTMGELRGCVNDVNLMESILKRYYGFKNIRKICNGHATTARILKELKWLVQGSKAGDVLYFHYSGHGSQVADRNNDEADRLDEILCPTDLNWRDKIVTDDDLARIFANAHPKANLSITLDCCHSGDGIRGGLVDPNAKLPKSKWLPTPEDVLDSETQQRLLKEDSVRRISRKKGILISGCKSNQTSADAWIQAEKKYMGACTYYMYVVLRRHRYKITYQKLVEETRKLLKKNGFTQVPQLNVLSGSPGKLFLS